MMAHMKSTLTKMWLYSNWEFFEDNSYQDDIQNNYSVINSDDAFYVAKIGSRRRLPSCSTLMRKHSTVTQRTAVCGTPTFPIRKRHLTAPTGRVSYPRKHCTALERLWSECHGHFRGILCLAGRPASSHRQAVGWQAYQVQI